MIKSELTRANIVDFILDLFARRGAEEYMGESVSMSQHMEQTAACATADGASDELVIAALLHDIGHFVGGFPIDALEKGIDNCHQDAGASFLAPFFPASITEPVRLHVNAKKYLCTVDQNYINRLSAASIESLSVQGGSMSSVEVQAFESNPYHPSALKVRHYDDDGKVVGLAIKPIKEYRTRIEALLRPESIK